MRRALRSTLKTTAFLVYTLAAVCLVLGAAEYTARKYLSSTRGRGSEQFDLRLDRWTAFHNTPNFTRTGVRHDRQGFRRDQDVTVEKLPNTVRLFLLGGSAAYGADTGQPEIDNRWKIDNHQTIDYYLEQELNASYPARHWEVINAAVKGFQLHQDLALLLALILHYRPDGVILMDGANDLKALLEATPNYDVYAQTGRLDEFNDLTHPGSLRSLGRMLSAWFANDSVLYRVVQDRIVRRARTGDREVRGRSRPVPANPQWADLTAGEQGQFKTSAGQLEHYGHVARQIHQVLALDGVQDLFVLQPVLYLTKKPLTEVETKLGAYSRANVGALEVYGFQALYPKLAGHIQEDALEGGFHFLDLIPVFDTMAGQAFTDYVHLTPDANWGIAHAIFTTMGGSFGVR